MRSRGWAAMVVAVGLVFAASAVRGPAATDDGPAAALALGLLVDELPPSGMPADARAAYARLYADWAGLPATDADYDWSVHASSIEALRAAGYRVVLALGGTLPSGELPSPLVGDSLERWLRFVRSAARTFAGRVEVLEIGQRVGPETDAERYAFLLKSSALAARAEARSRGAELSIAQAPVRLDAVATQRALWDREVAAYVDVLPVLLDAALDQGVLGAALAEVLAENLRHPPAAAVWAYALPDGERGPWVAAGAALRALSLGVPVALIGATGPLEQRSQVARWTVGAHRLLSRGFAPAPSGDLRFEDAAGGSLVGAQALGAFLSDADFTSLIFYRAPGDETDLPRDRLIVESAFVQNARLLDPLSGSELRVGSAPLDDGRRGRAVRIARSDHPRAVLFQRPAGSAGFELPPEEVETRRTRELTAQEIIARHQQVQKLQDDRLERWIARGRIDFHFKLVQGGATVDVSIDSNYFWQRGHGLEWEQTDYYINGNRVNWKKIPELPLIQPEKVITLPLDLTLDKTYTYRLVGRDRVAGQEAYVLEFQPVASDGISLYSGKVWIDAEGFHRTKVSLIQSGLESPVLSNEEIDRYALQTDGDGRPYWLLATTDGQQVWSAAGRNFVVRREVRFSDYELNVPREEFERRRNEAYASSNQMLRDTDRGFRYLERTADGSRQIKETVDSSQWFAAAGAFRDSSTDGVTPLLGANYFNYDLAGKNIQVNALFGGVVGFFTASKPDLLGKNVSGTVDAAGAAIFFSDEVFVGDDEIEEQRVDTRGQNVALRLGVPAGQFVKFNVIGGLTFRQYDEEEDGERAIDEYNMANPGQSLRFVLPQNHQELRGALEVEFNRRGYSVVGSASWSRRSDWQEWGLFDDASGSFVAHDPATGLFVPALPAAVEDSFRRWGVTGFKEWYLPNFQKVRGEINYLDGADLDRFSRYQFSLFGDDRLNGFSGTGVRFDEGWIARAGYSFNLLEVIRFDAVLENAWVEERDSVAGSQSFAGVGVAATVVGPWKTVINASYGRALASDIPDLEGQDEFLLLILKLF